MVSAPLSAVSAGKGNKDLLRLWLRLLRATRIIEGELRDRLKREFDSTLPRFDVMAALARRPSGMVMTDLSRFLLVSNGNVTGIVDRLVADGLVVRSFREGERRTSMVRLTPSGMELFDRMARAHENWITDLLGSIDPGEAVRIAKLLRSFSSNWEAEH